MTCELTIQSPKHGEQTVLYDAVDRDIVHNHRWYVHQPKQSGRLYVRTNVDNPDGGIRVHTVKGRTYHSTKQTSIGLHQMIMQTPKGMYTDHIDGNPLNNKRSNLRVCSNADNCRNRGINKNNTHGYKGVSYDGRRPHAPWSARVGFNYKRVYVGNYATKEEAARAYDKKALELHGEFARLNFGDSTSIRGTE